jgi:hypothetical protein
MGADIHLVLEEFDTERKRWVGKHDFSYLQTCAPSALSIYGRRDSPEERRMLSPLAQWRARTRNYRRFAKLAGVRGDGPNPKGLPADASDLTLLVLSESNDDLHSHTWYSLREACLIWLRTDSDNDEGEEIALAEAVTQQLKGKNWLPETAALYFGVDIDERYTPIDRYRICIAFDN